MAGSGMALVGRQLERHLRPFTEEVRVVVAAVGAQQQARQDLRQFMLILVLLRVLAPRVLLAVLQLHQYLLHRHRLPLIST